MSACSLVVTDRYLLKSVDENIYITCINDVSHYVSSLTFTTSILLLLFIICYQ